MVCALLFACGERPPNLVLIVADDLGYADIGVMGSTLARTPNIDRIAHEGIRFTDAYANAPLCEPSRAALLTGRYPNRSSGLASDEGDPTRGRFQLSKSEVFLPEPLRAVGYATAAIGKWHLGEDPERDPLARGFQAFFGFLRGWHDHFRWHPKNGEPILRNREPAVGDGYLTDAFSDEAVDFIERHRDGPFFLYLAYGAIHIPHQAPARYRAPFAAETHAQRYRLGMLAAMDDGVGRVLDALEAHGLADGTIVAFTSDNGGAHRLSENGPFRRGKGSLYEGGIRVPLLLRWPARLEAGRVYREVVSGMDLFPTFLAAAGVAPPEGVTLDGVDLLPHLEGERSDPPHRTHYWSSGAMGAMREGRFKLVQHGWTGTLYDLERDPGETRDLHEEHPDTAQRMHLEMKRWRAEMRREPDRAKPGS
jgi:arylsulfatase A-like enzyme